ncbi:MAG: hypothetical protein QXP04_00315 [Candidatus Nanoarchaeia archaeon]|nr:hypothetical protein [Candidatus Jingweiarchaeum tengchongense]
MGIDLNLIINRREELKKSLEERYKEKEREICANYGIDISKITLPEENPVPGAKTTIKSVVISKVPYLLAQRVDVPEMVTRTLYDNIIYAIQNDSHLFIPWWGSKGVGKSTGLLWYLKAYYKTWDKALYYFVHTLSEFNNKIEKEKYIPFLGWDDMVVHFGKWTSYTKTSTKEFAELFDAIRTEVGVLMPTMVDLGGISPAFRNAYMGEVFMPRRGLAFVEMYVKKVDAFKLGETFGKKYLTEVIFIRKPLPEDVKKRMSIKRHGMLQMKRSNLRLALTQEAIKQIEKFTPKEKEIGTRILKIGCLKTIYIEDMPEEDQNVVYALAGCGMMYEDQIGTFRTSDVGRTYLELIETEEMLKEENK